MRAYNSRKTCKEHFLFKYRHKKLSLTNDKGFKGIFRVRKVDTTNWLIEGEYFANRYCFKQLRKILTGSNREVSIRDFIRVFEKGYNVKISELGLTQRDFFEYKLNADKIKKALRDKGLVSLDESI